MKHSSKNISLALLSLIAVLAFGIPTSVRAQATESAATASGPEGAKSVAEKTEKKEEAKDESDQYRHSPMVTKLGSMMGMDSERAATAFTLSNLLILLVALGYLIMKSLPGTFRSRSTGIKKQLTDARTATQEATERLSSVEQRLSKMDEQIAAMRSAAEADAERATERMKAAAEEEKQRILTAASLEIQSATTTARREIMSYAAELAVEQAARKLTITSEMDRVLVENFANALTSKHGSQN
jgi:F-type H+-transporting ATPase subunit b